MQNHFSEQIKEKLEFKLTPTKPDQGPNRFESLP